ncbi:hypothetical protein KIPB_011890, partial [Kipferlia bialata]
FAPAHPVMACGGHAHSAVLTNEGTLYAMGSNTYGQLGLGTVDEEETPSPVGMAYFNGKRIISIACGYSHTLVVDEDNTVWAFGANESYQLGQGDTQDRDRPVPVTFPASHGGISMRGVPVTVHAYGSASYVLTSEGQLWSFGQNDSGQGGIGSQNGIPYPVLVDMSALPSASVLSVGPGLNHCLALLSTGDVVAWGSNEYGQLGVGRDGSQLQWSTTPVKVHATWGPDTPVSLDGGDRHSLVLTESGILLSMY